MFCPKCGSAVPDNALFCGTCGNEVRKQSNFAGSTENPQSMNQNPGPSDSIAVSTNITTKHSKAPMIIAISIVVLVVAIAAIFIYCLFLSPYPIDSDRFPDPAVRATLSRELDPDGDGLITRDEAAQVTSLVIDGALSVQGLEIFPNLAHLTLGGESLTSAYLENCASLESITAEGCKSLSELQLGRKDKLSTLQITDCALPLIDITGAPMLTLVDLHGNPMAELDTNTNDALTSLNIDATNISKLNLAGNPKLIDIKCDDSVVLENLDATPLHEYWVVESFDYRPTYDPSPNPVEATYDEKGNLIALKNNDYLYEYTYDDLNRCIKRTESSDNYSVSTETIEYDKNGNFVSSKEDGDGDNDGIVTTVKYNDAGFPVYMKSAIGSDYVQLNMDYKDDALSSMKISGQRGENCTIKNNKSGLIETIACKYNGVDGLGKFDISYDQSGNISQISYSDDEYTSLSYQDSFKYDSQGRIVDASHVYPHEDDFSYSIVSAKFEYNSLGMLEKMTPKYKGSNDYDSDLGYSIKYKRLILQRDTAPNCNFVNLNDPLSPSMIFAFWDPGAYFNNFRDIAYCKSMQHVMSKVSTSKK